MANQQPPLSEREMEVVRLLAHGHTQAYIASAVGISHSTVKSHVESIYEKLHVTSKDEEADWYWRAM